MIKSLIRYLAESIADVREKLAGIHGRRCPECGGPNISRGATRSLRRCDDCGFEWNPSWSFGDGSGISFDP